MKLSVVIPAYNEEGSIEKTLRTLYAELREEQIDHEIVVTNDNSKDETLACLTELAQEIPTLTHYTNAGPNGFGYAVRYGLERYRGDGVAVMMADLSDDPADLVRYYRTMVEGGYDCVFGSRWVKGGRGIDYPGPKRFINRMANAIVKTLFRLKYNDCTNAFKLYRCETMEGLKPFLSPHFNLTLELPLKAIVRGYSCAVVPNSWTNRKDGESKLKIKEMGVQRRDWATAVTPLAKLKVLYPALVSGFTFLLALVVIPWALLRRRQGQAPAPAGAGVCNLRKPVAPSFRHPVTLHHANAVAAAVYRASPQRPACHAPGSPRRTLDHLKKPLLKKGPFKLLNGPFSCASMAEGHAYTSNLMPCASGSWSE